MQRKICLHVCVQYSPPRFFFTVLSSKICLQCTPPRYRVCSFKICTVHSALLQDICTVRLQDIYKMLSSKICLQCAPPRYIYTVHSSKIGWVASLVLAANSPVTSQQDASSSLSSLVLSSSSKIIMLVVVCLDILLVHSQH